MTRDAPVSVAECPPLGEGGTPSIYGKAQSHCLSTKELDVSVLTFVFASAIDAFHVHLRHGIRILLL